MPAERLRGLVALVAAGRLTRVTARNEVWPRMVETGRTAEEVVAELGLGKDDVDLDALVAAAIEALPESAASFRGGKAAAIGPLVGHVLRAARGRADAREVRDRIAAALRD
jgi:aspartyl-tRNA(Asn)/glutamyl-tRNA(Gln) amidotransferase subunit B